MSTTLGSNHRPQHTLHSKLPLLLDHCLAGTASVQDTTKEKDTMNMTIGDKVRASYPYGGVPACDGKIVKKLILGRNTQFLVSFEIRPRVYKKFYLTERELTLCATPEPQQA
jgi:hypothetical protein